MNKAELSAAYAELVDEFQLTAKSRDLLDRSEDYTELMQLVHDKKWATVEAVMMRNNYFRSDRPDDGDPKFELVG